MPRVKVTRKSTATDMTAMCDVAFLLLTFFILSAKPKTQDPVKADTPAASAIIPIPETDFAIISVGTDKGVNKIFFSIEGDDLRTGTLKAMSDEYKVSFTPDEIKEFAHLEAFGVPLNQLKQYLSLPPAQKKAVDQPGLKVDTNKSNELADFVLQARKAGAALHNKQLQVAIRADKQEYYPIVETIIKSLQKQNLNKFSLITSSLATAPKK